MQVCAKSFGVKVARSIGIAVMLLSVGTGGVAQAQDRIGSSPYLSQNLVGYVKRAVRPGEFALLSWPFESFSIDRVDSEFLVGPQLPVGSVVYAFDVETGRYIRDVREANGWTSNIAYSRGMSFWVALPEDAPDEEYFIFLLGQVPSVLHAATTEQSVRPGVNLLAYPYPVTRAWRATSLAEEAPVGSWLYTYDGEHFFAVQKTDAGWGEEEVDLVVGTGFLFYNPSAEPFTWTEAAPYQWP